MSVSIIDRACGQRHPQFTPRKRMSAVAIGFAHHTHYAAPQHPDAAYLRTWFTAFAPATEAWLRPTSRTQVPHTHPPLPLSAWPSRTPPPLNR